MTDIDYPICYFVGFPVDILNLIVIKTKKGNLDVLDDAIDLLWRIPKALNCFDDQQVIALYEEVMDAFFNSKDKAILKG